MHPHTHTHPYIHAPTNPHPHPQEKRLPLYIFEVATFLKRRLEVEAFDKTPLRYHLRSVFVLSNSKASKLRSRRLLFCLLFDTSTVPLSLSLSPPPSPLAPYSFSQWHIL